MNILQTGANNDEAPHGSAQFIRRIPSPSVAFSSHGSNSLSFMGAPPERVTTINSLAWGKRFSKRIYFFTELIFLYSKLCLQQKASPKFNKLRRGHIAAISFD